MNVNIWKRKVNNRIVFENIVKMTTSYKVLIVFIFTSSSHGSSVSQLPSLPVICANTVFKSA